MILMQKCLRVLMLVVVMSLLTLLVLVYTSPEMMSWNVLVQSIPRYIMESSLVYRLQQQTSYTPLHPGNSNLPYDDTPVTIPGDGTNIYVETQPQADTTNPPLKKILFWNDFFGDQSYGFGFGREPFIRGECRVNTCFTTANRTRFPLHQLDAVIWHVRSKDRSLPKERWPHTRYIFYTLESPPHVYLKDEYNGTFNWTFTYRRDSDFPNMYGEVFRRHEPLPEEQVNYAEGKTKLVAWFVSNCHTHSGREKLVEALRKWIPVDQYGKCSKKRCERSKGDNCHGLLNQDYKFYLSFENSICKDYVTEKLFSKLSLNVLPVVYGGANYSNQAPPYSYIDAQSFPSIKNLADYLLYLHHNDTAYNEYFRWKRFHLVRMRWERTAKHFCDLCERLHTDNSTKIYNIKECLPVEVVNAESVVSFERRLDKHWSRQKLKYDHRSEMELCIIRATRNIQHMENESHELETQA
ncbi:hypothetical protein Pcinc_022043 [Petrolisthes cinctipes]|uniref:Fucosyltransferase n=1 Tax=Petrolisthes cinctipes TaxID=88211 RepID=A0AAE1FIQ0_PETCI|nr:hypothetical protein Pcinc_022043 [Petrolisthes cinctipes]